jgi:hypothetical protein
VGRGPFEGEARSPVDGAVQGQLPDEPVAVEVQGTAAEAEDGHGDGEVEAGAFLGNLRGGQVAVRRRVGNVKPELLIAVLTRSRASWIARSVRPTMVKLGRPGFSIGLLVAWPDGQVGCHRA